MRERIHKLEEAIRYMINHDCSLEDFAKILLECGISQYKIEEIHLINFMYSFFAILLLQIMIKLN